MKKTTSIVVSMLLILMFATVGCAQDQSRPNGPPPSKEQLFQDFDLDGDGMLSQEEFPGPDEHFTQFDTNSDGFIEKDEMPDGPPPRGNRGE